MIKIKYLTKKFDDYTALNDVNCTIGDGCIYGMVGSNGAGKSTFLRLIAGVYKPDMGEISIDGKAVYNNPEIKSQIAFVSDDPYFINGASLERMALLYSSIYKNWDASRFEYLVKSFRLNSKKSINTFSKGMRRQAAIILALACRPRYMFFDETFDGLDPVMRNLVKGLISKDVSENHATVIITSHSLREMENLCDQLALLHMGGLVLESDIKDMKTSLFKVQIAFSTPFDEKLFTGVKISHYSQSGSVANIIVKGDKAAAVEYFQSLQPVLMDVLPLTLEEVFTYEMAALGYSFEDITKEGAQA